MARHILGMSNKICFLYRRQMLSNLCDIINRPDLWKGINILASQGWRSDGPMKKYSVCIQIQCQHWQIQMLNRAWWHGAKPPMANSIIILIEELSQSNEAFDCCWFQLCHLMEYSKCHTSDLFILAYIFLLHHHKSSLLEPGQMEFAFRALHIIFVSPFETEYIQI